MVRLVKVEKENVTSDGDGGILSLANNIRNRVMNALPANASASKVPQDVLKSTVGVFSTAVTLDDEFEEFEKETDAKAQQFLEAQQKILKLKNQDLLKSTVGVLEEVVTKGGKDKTAVTLDDDEELVVEKPLTYHKAEVQAEVQRLIVEQKRLREGQKKASNVNSGVQTADADRNNIHNILRKLQRSVNRIEHRQKTLQDDLKALQVQVQARQSQIRHSPSDIDALAEAVVAKLQTNG